MEAMKWKSLLGDRWMLCEDTEPAHILLRMGAFVSFLVQTIDWPTSQMGGCGSGGRVVVYPRLFQSACRRILGQDTEPRCIHRSVSVWMLESTKSQIKALYECVSETCSRRLSTGRVLNWVERRHISTSPFHFTRTVVMAWSFCLPVRAPCHNSQPHEN